MTDPVDTDALRKIADELSTAISDPYDCEPLLRAAADEVDRLRSELSSARLYRDAWKSGMEVAGDQYMHTKQENKRLRAAIENAPHADWCMIHALIKYDRICNCWKADVL